MPEPTPAPLAVTLPPRVHPVAVVPVPGPRGPRGPAGEASGSSTPPLVADPAHPGLYLLADGTTALIPDPAHPGLYLIGA